MYNIQDIVHVHLEISSRCNASCSLCPRNFYGYEYNDGYVERDLTLADAQQIFRPNFLKQLKNIYINGNFGDAVMNPETVDIIKYFRSHNSNMRIEISSNGGARDRKFWQDLAHLRVEVIFCIDGFEDTHHLYRKNTVYSTVIRNAQTFIAAGGRAVWKMIKFDFNKHQWDKAKEVSQQLGFQEFQLISDGRDTAPVFDNQGNLLHTIGNPAVTDFDTLFRARTQSTVLLEDITTGRKARPIECRVKKRRSIFVSSTGDVYPCCWLGFAPKTYGHGNYHQAANAQFRHLINQNNALEHDLAHCIQWFDSIENTWKIPEFEQGRLVICNDVCGKDQ